MDPFFATWSLRSILTSPPSPSPAISPPPSVSAATPSGMLLSRAFLDQRQKCDMQTGFAKGSTIPVKQRTSISLHSLRSSFLRTYHSLVTQSPASPHDLASELVGDRFLRQVSGSRTEGSWCFQLFMRFALRILLWANNMGDLPTWEWCLDQRPTGMTAFRARTLLKPLKYKIFTPWLTENKIGRVNLDLQAAFLPLDAAPPTGDLEEAESNVNQSVSDCRGRLLDLGWSTPSDERWSALRRFPVLDEFADVDCCLGLVPECKERMRELLLLRGYLSTRLPVQDRATYRDDIRARDVDLDELSD
ncbi:hypothetical protein C8F01DRAFT_199834 [Mycena amicta]|nr:hypothetical protein C8F01DRAFT_199834 [Mycena amicta]